jgi:hypothetical protein
VVGKRFGGVNAGGIRPLFFLSSILTAITFTIIWTLFWSSTLMLIWGKEPAFLLLAEILQ